MTKFLDQLDKITGEYADTAALILLGVGSLVVAVSLGVLPHGGTTAGYSFVYLKHPVTLKVGLVGIVVGFIVQLADNLMNAHKLNRKKVAWVMGIVFVFLILLVLGN